MKEPSKEKNANKHSTQFHSILTKEVLPIPFKAIKKIQKKIKVTPFKYHSFIRCDAD